LRLGGPDEPIVGDAERIPCGPKALRHEVAQLDGGHAPALGLLLDLLAVLVGAGQEEDLGPVLPVEARQHVREDRRVRVAEVGLPGRVVDGRREVTPTSLGHGAGVPSPLGWARPAAGPTSSFSSARVTTRRPPSASRRLTVSAQMSTETTFSSPLDVRIRRPSRGKRRRASTYVLCSYIRQHIRRP